MTDKHDRAGEVEKGDRCAEVQETKGRSLLNSRGNVRMVLKNLSWSLSNH
ncbi:hypothetical protein H6F90_29630 [Trichocoleus sp. FACHB-591]|nr:hypothetical protein [Trichocoleus sp. FACHB-591]MBD2099228.1 hypothetical protein [Trichocoleus sp. FACHB-591]